MYRAVQCEARSTEYDEKATSCQRNWYPTNIRKAADPQGKNQHQPSRHYRPNHVLRRIMRVVVDGHAVWSHVCMRRYSRSKPFGRRHTYTAHLFESGSRTVCRSVGRDAPGMGIALPLPKPAPTRCPSVIAEYFDKVLPFCHAWTEPNRTQAKPTMKNPWLRKRKRTSEGKGPSSCSTGRLPFWALHRQQAARPARFGGLFTPPLDDLSGTGQVGLVHPNRGAIGSPNGNEPAAPPRYSPTTRARIPASSNNVAQTVGLDDIGGGAEFHNPLAVRGGLLRMRSRPQLPAVFSGVWSGVRHGRFARLGVEIGVPGSVLGRAAVPALSNSSPICSPQFGHRHMGCRPRLCSQIAV